MNRTEREFNQLWGDLAVYNAEVARGIIHTAVWDSKMEQKQAAYNAWISEPRPRRWWKGGSG